MGRWACKPVNHTSWVAVVTPTDRPKSVRNRCLIELFCGVVYVFTLPFWHFCWYRGFCHRTGSDHLLFVYFVWLRITDEGSVLEMRIWSILLIQSDLKWCIHLGRSLFLYFKSIYFRQQKKVFNKGKLEYWQSQEGPRRALCKFVGQWLSFTRVGQSSLFFSCMLRDFLVIALQQSVDGQRDYYRAPASEMAGP